ncbi:MAG: hypothetical protein K2J48_06795, partial [Muribaculaceae bacterium]|nr:hypothetical protein [Muribaculaceae bacterium]
MRKLISIFILLTFIPIFSCSRQESASLHPGNPRDQLKALDHTLDNIDIYRNKKRLIIDSLQAQTHTLTDSIEIWKTLLELSSQYRLLNADSAVIAAQHAIYFSTSSLSADERLHTKLTFIQALSTSGLFYAALTSL